jgi:hypothetical protein
MLDPEEFSDYQRNPGKKYDNPSAVGQNTTNLLSELNNSPTFEKRDDDDYGGGGVMMSLTEVTMLKMTVTI